MTEDLIQTIYESHIQQLRKLGIEGDQATESALHQLEEIEQRHGGAEVYIPKYSRVRKAHRDQHITQAWRQGENRADIARRYGVGQTTVSRVIQVQPNSPPEEWFL